jgi:catechol 2,3-dioxygenase-like lactoylglutathione lyase family enzyme
MQIMELTQVRLIVSDFPACFRFYRDVLAEPAVMWERLRVAYLRDPEGNLIELQEWLVSA